MCLHLMKTAIVMGTRPEIIKLAPIIENLPKKNCEIIFTGQHYDYQMGLKFFDQLGIRNPDHVLKIAKSLPAFQIGQIITNLSRILQDIVPDTVIVQGDTNTVLAASICSLKLDIPISHVESGLRSFDWRMPEEHNRIATDHISELLFAPTQTAKSNLQHEKVHGKIFVTGNTVIDSIKKYSQISSKNSSLSIDNKEFILLTMHRSENVDDKRTLSILVKAITTSNKKIIFPIHPRTLKKLKEFNLLNKLQTSKTVTLLNSTGYFEMLELMKKCSFIITDSGGIQEEATAPQIRKKTFVIRKTTDRPEAVKSGFSNLIGMKYGSIVSAIKNGETYAVPKKQSPYGKGTSSKEIISCIKKIFD